VSASKDGEGGDQAAANSLSVLQGQSYHLTAPEVLLSEGEWMVPCYVDRKQGVNTLPIPSERPSLTIRLCLHIMEIERLIGTEDYEGKIRVC
jgi:hypothetical protein